MEKLFLYLKELELFGVHQEFDDELKRCGCGCGSTKEEEGLRVCSQTDRQPWVKAMVKREMQY